ncbi:penicillin-binding protein 2 [bacterium]|nr:penicillin-binding protein 2 [bacterium]NBW57558.1 penicillin-binding protein 2 [bacterium]NBX71950.1 penicillin-binding protein 2 [bacterium]
MKYLERISPGRIYFVIFCYSLLACVLITRLAYLQLIEGSRYAEKAKKNIVAYLYEPAPRGIIFDRKNIPLVQNEHCWDLYFYKGNKKQLNLAIKDLSSVIDDPLLKTAAYRLEQQPSFEPLLLLTDLSEQQLGSISYMVYDRPFLTLKNRSIRTYPYYNICAHIIGYTQPQKVLRFNHEHPSAERAITGIEKACDHQLRGKPKVIAVDKTARQLIVQSTELKPSEPGDDIHLTLDIQLQAIAYKILESFNVVGSIVALDPRSGEILVAVSYPSYNPELVRSQPLIYNQDSRLPLFFRALNGLYPPASLVKPILGLAALEEGLITTQTTLVDPGYYQLKGYPQRFHDWKKHGHGEVNLKKAIAQSCDTFFYSLGDQLGIDVMSDWFARFGFGKDFNLPISQKTGILPSKQWKMTYFKESWYPGESVLTAIGQGYFSSTPLHLSYAAALLASKGTTPLPSLILNQATQSHEDYFGSVQYWNVIHEAMDAVITSTHGTAHRRLAKFNLPIIGKTGTAQVVSHQKAQLDLQTHLDHSLFMAFAPKKNPTIALAVVVEHQNCATDIAGAFFNELVAQNFLSKDE